MSKPAGYRLTESDRTSLANAIHRRMEFEYGHCDHRAGYWACERMAGEDSVVTLAVERIVRNAVEARFQALEGAAFALLDRRSP